MGRHQLHPQGSSIHLTLWPVACVQAPEKRSVPSASGAIVGHRDGTIHGSAAASPFHRAQEFVEREGTRGPNPQPATAQSWVVFDERDVLLFNMRGCVPRSIHRIPTWSPHGSRSR